MRFRLLIVLLTFTAAAVPEEIPSLTLANGKLELSVLVQGSTMANLTLAGDSTKFSPLWNPDRKSGAGFGHFVCVDGFGPVSTEENAAGLTGHGEAHVQTYQVRQSGKQDGTTVLTLTAKLPIVQEVFTRTFRMVDGENVIYVESTLENLMGFDRPVNWAEHATIGSPFLESGVTAVDMSGTRSRTRPNQPTGPAERQQRLVAGKDFTWPMAPGLDGTPINLRFAPDQPHYLDHTATLLDPSRKLEWVTALNPKKKLILGYLFRRDDYPWMQYWGDYPPTGKFARGMEFGTQPFDVPRREAISAGAMFDTPLYRWLPAKATIETKFLLFYTALPDGFTKIDDVRLENGRIVIEDHTANKRVSLNASRGLE
jgi:hypothetical protein